MVRRWGLPEYLGIVVSLVCLVWWAPINDYLAGPKLLVLVAGALGALPAVIRRWRKGMHPGGVAWIPVGAALGLATWSLLSLIFSGGPLPVSLMGWWGRSNGFLSLLAVALILLAATTLRRGEVSRVVTWLLVGATAVALIGLAQLSGTQVVGGLPTNSVIATMGNTNFSAAYFAIMGVLAIGRALTGTAPLWQRVWAALLAVILVLLASATGAEQGPASLAAGLVALLVLWSLAYRGSHRRLALIASAGVVGVSAAVTLASFAGYGPLAFLWQDINFRIRQGTWATGWEVASAMPIFGTGPDGLQRFANEYSPDFYIELVGTQVPLSAAHNVPLQYAATLGFVAGALWVVAMVSAALLLLVAMGKRPQSDAVLAASIGGAFVAYLTQAMVSIDASALLATGWILLGLVIVLASPGAEPAVESPPPSTPVRRTPVPPTKRGRNGASGRAPAQVRPVTPSSEPTPVWVPVAGVLLGALGVATVAPSLVIESRTSGMVDADGLTALLESPWTPCASRIPLTQVALQNMPTEQSIPAVYAAADLDPRCDTITNIQAEVAILQEDVGVAERSTLAAITYNPDLATAWILRSRYHLLVGDLSAAESDYDVAASLIERFPGNDIAVGSLESLRKDLDSEE